MKTMPISFSSKINFVNEKKFFEETSKPNATKVENDLYGDYQKISEGNIYTRCISSCTAYGLIKTKDYFLGHFNTFANDITDLISQKDKRGFIIGGYVSEMKKYFDEAFKVFQDAKLKTSVLWGQQNLQTNACYNSDEDTWYINKPIKELFDDDGRRLGYKDVESIDDLKLAYNIINIADGDEVYINDKYVPAELINQNNENYKT